MNHLTVFARPPLAGHVKSRLSPALPAALAARLYDALLADTLAAALACGADTRVVAWSEAGGDPALPAGFAAQAQSPGDLGERLAHAFARALARPGDAAVVVGSDCPGLRRDPLDAAFAALATHDAVIGPARDGGYWLLGLKHVAPELFRDVPWSSGSVAALTLERMAALGLRVARLETVADMDTPDDLAALVGDCARGTANACGPRAREALRDMGLLP